MSSFFLVITPCSLLKVTWRFALPATCFQAGFFLSLFFDPEDGGDMFLQKVALAFNRLHGLIYQKIELFITTAVRTSNPTWAIIHCLYWASPWPENIFTQCRILLNVGILSQVYTLFTVLKRNLVFDFRCFLHYHFHATCFGNSLPSSGVVPLTISLQFLLKSMWS
jgi:hypothetical protein